jgi:toxin ParE1/3/4
MTSIQKRPQVIRDLIELATYIAEGNMDASDRFLLAAEETFKQLAQMPKMGKLCQFSDPNLIDVRQQAIKGFRRYLIFYRLIDSGVEILRVIHGARDIEDIFDNADENE